MIDTQELFLTEEQIREFQARKSSRRSEKKPKREIQFFQFPKPVLVTIIRSGYMPALAVAAAIHETWYRGFRRNPITLTSTRLGEFRISKDQKLRALKILEQSGCFLVKRFRGRNPVITLKWLRIED
jgi:hypothetical protein